MLAIPVGVIILFWVGAGFSLKSGLEYRNICVKPLGDEGWTGDCKWGHEMGWVIATMAVAALITIAHLLWLHCFARPEVRQYIDACGTYFCLAVICSIAYDIPMIGTIVVYSKLTKGSKRAQRECEGLIAIGGMKDDLDRCLQAHRYADIGFGLMGPMVGIFVLAQLIGWGRGVFYVLFSMCCWRSSG
jgi:hypothetical protein